MLLLQVGSVTVDIFGSVTLLKAFSCTVFYVTRSELSTHTCGANSNTEAFLLQIYSGHYLE